MSNIDLVVARYNEDVNWLKKVPKNINIILYNKGKDDIQFKFIKLDNIGRESHTYLYHIINNYDKLADKTIFTQGDPFSHNPDFLEFLGKTDDFQKVQPLAYYYNDETPPKEFTEAYYKLFGTKLLVPYFDNDFQIRFPFLYLYNKFNVNFFDKTVKKVLKTDNILEYYKKKLHIENIDLKYLLPYNHSATFCIERNVIRERNIKFYENCLKILLDTKEFDFGFVLERLWLTIFYYEKYNCNYLKLLVNDHKIKDLVYNIKNNKINIKTDIFYNQYFSLILDDNKIFIINLFKEYVMFNFNKKSIKFNLRYKLEKDLNISINLKDNQLKIYINSNKFVYNVNSKTFKKFIFHHTLDTGNQMEMEYYDYDPVGLNYNLKTIIPNINSLSLKKYNFDEIIFNKEKNELKRISSKFNTDKFLEHGYNRYYEGYLNKFKDDEFTLFEIGVYKGNSHDLWLEYFPNAYILGLDIDIEWNAPRIKVIKGDQSKMEDLEKIVKLANNCKFIIDDGSHHPDHQLLGFNYLFEHLLEDGGIYIIEDIETSYWKDGDLYGYNIKAGVNEKNNIVNIFTDIVNIVNRKFILEKYQKVIYEKSKLSKYVLDHISSIHFGMNCIIVQKMEDNERNLYYNEYKFKKYL